MSIEYIDKFVVNGATYGLESTDAGYKLWSSGCGIGSECNRDTARKLLHIYICSRLRAEHRAHKEIADKAAAALAAIEGDVFKLAKFMQ